VPAGKEILYRLLSTSIFLWGLRFLQFSFLSDPTPQSRAIPIDFIEAPSLKKPGKRAPAWVLESDQKAKKETNLSSLFVKHVKKLRHR
jgi:hypothetical protein